MILQYGTEFSEGGVWWIIFVTIIVTVALVILKSVISGIIEFFMVKKKENEEQVKKEVRNISTIMFIALAGLVLIFARVPIAHFLQRPVDEILIAGFMIIVFSILIGGLIYRRQIPRVRKKLSRTG